MPTAGEFDEFHLEHYHVGQTYVMPARLASMLILAGSLAATKQAGWQVLGFLTGAAFLYLGGAALLLPDYAGSWGTMGGVLGLLAGLGYIIATLVAARRSRQVTSSTTPEMGSTSS